VRQDEIASGAMFEEYIDWRVKPPSDHPTFGHGLHFCLGARLARLGGRVALDEMLNRLPEWDLDYDGLSLFPTSTVRGWERMPILLG
jgi:cytochrome P450